MKMHTILEEATSRLNEKFYRSLRMKELYLVLKNSTEEFQWLLKTKVLKSISEFSTTQICPVLRVFTVIKINYTTSKDCFHPDPPISSHRTGIPNHPLSRTFFVCSAHNNVVWAFQIIWPTQRLCLDEC